MKYLLFSHGFGVKKDSRGMFTDIAKAFPQYQSVMFEYNEHIQATNTSIVRSYSSQAKLLDKHIEDIKKKDPDAEITLLAHSQGCIVAGLSKYRTYQSILLAPPSTVSAKRSRLRPNRTARINGSVIIHKKDGSRILLTSGFMLGLRLTNPIKIYEKLSVRQPTLIIIARKDDMIDNNKLQKHSSLNINCIDGDHNFTGQARKGLIKALSKYI